MVDVSDIIKRYLKQSPFIKQKPERWYNFSIELLKPLAEKNYIKIVVPELKVPIEPVPDDWIDELNVAICILPEGVLFLFEKRKIRQQVITNWLTFFFIAVTVIIGVANYQVAKKTLNITESNNTNEASVSILKSLVQKQSEHIKKLQEDSIHKNPKMAIQEKGRPINKQYSPK